jgi:hypothetical protein
MSRPVILALLLVASLLTGCLYYPTVTHTTDASTLNSPYRGTYVDFDVKHKILSISISDKAIDDAEFKKMKLVDAILITESGKEIEICPPWSTTYGVGVTYWFKFQKLGFDDDKFGLRLVTELNGKKTTITGKFTVHGHFEIIDVIETLDHG